MVRFRRNVTRRTKDGMSGGTRRTREEKVFGEYGQVPKEPDQKNFCEDIQPLRLQRRKRKSACTGRERCTT